MEEGEERVMGEKGQWMVKTHFSDGVKGGGGALVRDKGG